MDVSGEHQANLDATVYKQRLDLDGTPIDNELVRESLDPEERKLDEQRAAQAQKTKEPGYCGSCYGAESAPGECCNTCESIKQAYLRKGWAFGAKDDVEQCYAEVLDRKRKYAKKEGCYLSGYFLVNKVAGNFHFAPGRSLHQVCHMLCKPIRHIPMYMIICLMKLNTLIRLILLSNYHLVLFILVYKIHWITRSRL